MSFFLHLKVEARCCAKKFLVLQFRFPLSPSIPTCFFSTFPLKKIEENELLLLRNICIDSELLCYFRDNCDILRYYGEADAPILNEQTGYSFPMFFFGLCISLFSLSVGGGSEAVEITWTASLWQLRTTNVNWQSQLFIVCQLSLAHFQLNYYHSSDFPDKTTGIEMRTTKGMVLPIGRAFDGVSYDRVRMAVYKSGAIPVVSSSFCVSDFSISSRSRGLFIFWGLIHSRKTVRKQRSYLIIHRSYLITNIVHTV